MWRKIFGYCFLMCAAFVFIFSIYFLNLIRNLPDPRKIAERQIHESTKIYDRTGHTLLYEIFSEKKRTLIDIETLPTYVINATLAIEDKYFYSHKGIAWKSIARAALANLLRRETGRGGASTLTQQLVKNAIVGDERSFARKIKEAMLAWNIERTFSKKEILTLYFNEIPYGRTYYGVEAASQNYFGKHAAELSLAEAATLAALPQAPTRYLNNQERLMKRRDYILELMVAQGYASSAEVSLAKEEKTVLQRSLGLSLAPHFVLMVTEQLGETLGEQMVSEGGLDVITTIDIEKQKIAEDEVTRAVASNRKKYNAYNGALVGMDVITGEIVAYVGSADYSGASLPENCTPGVSCKFDGQVDVARRPRQPGSSFKPLVYLAGFMKGYTPETILYDVVTNFKTDLKDYTPHNYDNKERGPVTLRTALQGSLNIPSVKMLYLAGIDTVLELAKSFGYTTLGERSRFGLSLVLGGGEITLLEHTTAYGTLAREGNYLPPVSILSIKNSKGKILYEHLPLPAKPVADKDAVATLTQVLSDNVARSFVFGTHSPLSLGERPVAAKTGTTNDYRDGWLMGYTPTLVVGAWAGNNDNSPMLKAGGSLAAGAMFNGFMKRNHEGTAVIPFSKLPEPKTNNVVLLGKINPAVEEIEIDVISGKRVTEFTPAETRQKKQFFQGHSILYWIDKNDPEGTPPRNPSDDPQFERWEEAIRQWAEKQNIVMESPPQDFDDVHTPELTPSISFVFPAQGAAVPREAEVSVSVSAPAGNVMRVKYYIDGKEIHESISAPHFAALLNLSPFTTGFHTLTASAFDEKWNKGSVSAEINITGPAGPPEVIWEFPPPGISLSDIDFPIVLSARFSQSERIQEAELKEEAPGKVISTLSVITNPKEAEEYTLEKRSGKPGLYKYFWQLTYDKTKDFVTKPLLVQMSK